MVDKQKRKAMSMEIAERLAVMRREKGFSQEDLAGQLGLSRQAISKWERGESAPDMGNLIALADLYEVSLDELIRGEGAGTETTPKTAASEKVDVTINTFINEEKTKPAEASTRDEAAAKSVPVATSTPAPAPTPAPVAAPPACPPPAPAPQMQPTIPVYQHVPGHAVVSAPAEPKPTSEVWMTFPYPLFCALLYLVLGFLFGLWHPGWIIFLTIPFFYWIVRVVKQDPNYIATHTPSAEDALPNEVRRP